MALWDQEGRWSARRFGTDGKPDGAAFQPFGDGWIPEMSLAATSMGFAIGAVQTREVKEGTLQDAFVQFFDAGGTVIGPKRRASRDVEEIDVALSEGVTGGIVASSRSVYRDGTTVTRFGATGPILGEPFEVDVQRQLKSYGTPRLVEAMPDGRTLVIVNDDFDGRILAAVYSPKGSLVGKPVEVFDEPLYAGSFLDVERLPNGDMAVIMVRSQGEDLRYGTFLTIERLDADGRLRGGSLEVKLDTPGDEDGLPDDSPATIEFEALESGHLLVTWSVADSSGGTARTYRQLIATEKVEGYVEGGKRADVLRGTRHEDVILGRDGDDTLRGRGGDDVLHGGAGSDDLRGSGGSDDLCGHEDDDLLIGGDGGDRLHGGAGDDYLRGGDHMDLLRGGLGDDRLKGGDGQDVLDGGGGRDEAWGGAGADAFVFSRRDEFLVIRDFEAGRDEIVIDQALSDYTGDGRHVVREFASIEDGDAVLRFGGGDVLRVEGITELSAIRDALEIV